MEYLHVYLAFAQSWMEKPRVYHIACWKIFIFNGNIQVNKIIRNNEGITTQITSGHKFSLISFLFIKNGMT